MTIQENARTESGILRRLRRTRQAKAAPPMTAYQILFYTVANALLRAVFRILAHVEVTGAADVPRQGALIVIGNHTSWLDPLLVGAFVPRRVVFMSKKENFHNPLARFIVWSYGVFPVDRGNVDRSALQRMDSVLLSGGALGMFPEGTRSRSGELRRGKAGTALVAVQHGAPILPVAIAGAHKGLFGQLFRLHRPRFSLVMGPTFTLPAMAEGTAVNKQMLNTLTDDLMRPLAANLPAEQRGYYQ